MNINTRAERLEAVSNAMEYTGDSPEKGTRANIYIIKDSTPEELRSLLVEIIFDNIDTREDVSYEIASEACNVFAELELGELDEYDPNERDQEFASVYTADRLGYLSINNQEEISDLMKEYDCDIQTACAVWYDDQVYMVIDKLYNWIMEGEEEQLCAICGTPEDDDGRCNCTNKDSN